MREGKDLLLRHSPDGEILARNIKVLHQRVSMGLFTMFIKIRAHRGEFLNEKADRWSDEGRRISIMYDGMGLAYNLLSRGMRKESNTDAP